MTAILRPWATWTLGFVAFPIAGLAGRALAGPVDDPLAALAGGAVTGLVLGAVQALAARSRLRAGRWIPATMAGYALGLALGSAAVGYGISLPELAAMGAVTGAVLGIAQALALAGPGRHGLAWAAVAPALWALGWTVTTLAGVDVEAQYTVFGATGALTWAALSGLLLARLPEHARASAPVAEGQR